MSCNQYLMEKHFNIIVRRIEKALISCSIFSCKRSGHNKMVKSNYWSNHSHIWTTPLLQHDYQNPHAKFPCPVPSQKNKDIICDSVKIAPQKIAHCKNTHLWKFPPLEFPPSENRPLGNFPQENNPQNINPKEIVPYESFHHSCEKMKVVTIQSKFSHEK